MSCTMQRWLIGIAVFQIWSWDTFAAQKITAIDFKGTSDPNLISIQSSGPVTYEKQENSQDKQVILEIKGARISKTDARKIDTSSFNSKVSLISPYQVEGQPDTVRVVIQLREVVPLEVFQEGNLIKVKIPNGGSGNSSSNSNTMEGIDTAITSAASPSNDTPPVGDAAGAMAVASSAASMPPGAPPVPGAPGASSHDNRTILDDFSESKQTQRYIGRPVTLQVRDVEVSDVLRLIGEASGFNIVIGDEVKGKLTLSLVDVPWDQALDLILHTMRLGAERNNNILRIVTLQNLTAEKQEELAADKAAKLNAPRVTRVFPISYASLDGLQKILGQFASSAGAMAGGAAASGGGGAASGAGAGGKSVATVDPLNAPIVQADTRTNSLIVRDLPENIERMKKLIDILDTQTPQVIIEAKVVEATEGFSKTLGGNLGVGGPQLFASFAGGNPTDALIGNPGVFANGGAISGASAPASGNPLGTFGVSPNVSFIPGGATLNAVLNWGESENQVKVVSAPKTVVLNKQTASIVEGTPVLVPGTTTVNGVGTVPTQTVDYANISLNVTPTVTNDGSVLMDLKVSRDVPVPLGTSEAVGKRNLNTQVLVESGTTLVIGGIYTMQTSYTGAGFPFLRKIPILGALFGSDSESLTRSELFIFITPRVLNPKEAGLSG